jgi:hypothetical protein
MWQHDIEGTGVFIKFQLFSNFYYDLPNFEPRTFGIAARASDHLTTVDMVAKREHEPV